MAAGWIEVPGHGLVNLDLVRSIQWTDVKNLRLVFDPGHSITLIDTEEVLKAIRARIAAGVPAALIDGGPKPDEGADWWAPDPRS